MGKGTLNPLGPTPSRKMGLMPRGNEVKGGINLTSAITPGGGSGSRREKEKSTWE